MQTPGVKQQQNIKSDGFKRTVNPDAVHNYAMRNGMESLSYSLVRACYLRDVKAGRASA